MPPSHYIYTYQVTSDLEQLNRSKSYRTKEQL
jgi:hypothetical protein